MERNDRDLWSLSPHPTPFLPDSCSMASVCQHAEGNAAKQPEIEMITTSLCPSQPAHWKLIPTNKLLSTCQRGRESESNSVCWEREKMCGKVNVRSPNKLGLMTFRPGFFPLFSEAALLWHTWKNAINTIGRSSPTEWWSNDECQKMPAQGHKFSGWWLSSCSILFVCTCGHEMLLKPKSFSLFFFFLCNNYNLCTVNAWLSRVSALKF